MRVQIPKWSLIVPTVAVLAATAMSSVPEPTLVTVYKSPTCGCCTRWVEHLRDNGFVVSVVPLEGLVARKAELGVPDNLQSCHTAIVEGYVVEGHVPAAVLRAFLDARPHAAGLAVPGMPTGSPGMEGPTSEPYDVIQWSADGRWRVVARRPARHQR